MKSDNYAPRIAAIRRELCHCNNREFAKRIGTSPQHASALCIGTTQAALGTLDLILNAFPELNRDWLFFGEGNMLNSGSALGQNYPPTPSDIARILRQLADQLDTL